MTAGAEALELLEHRWRLSPDLLAEHLTTPREGRPHPPYAYTRPPHLRLIARKFRECAARPGGRLILNVGPQHAKSSSVSHFGTTWYLSLNPRSHVGLISYQGNFAGTWGRKVRNTIADNSDELGIELAKDSKAAGAFDLASGGGMWTAGADGSISGRPAGLISYDDPHKGYEDSHSPVQRAAVWNTYLGSVRTRLAPGASIFVVHTRWHEKDLTGMLTAQDAEGIGEGWEVVRLPAIAEEHEEWDLGNDEIWVREPGDALWPERYPIEYLEATRATLGPYLFAALYQQRPAPAEGNLVSRDWFSRRWTVLPDRFDEWLASIDCAFKDASDSDFVVIQVWARLGADRYLIHEVHARLSFTETCRAVENVAAMFPKVRKILVEDKANGPAVVNAMKSKIAGLVERNPRGSKESRLVGCQGEMEAGNVVLPSQEAVEWNVAEFIEELCTFPSASHDDRVDACTQALLEWGALAPAVSKVVMSSPAAVKKMPTKKKRPPSASRR